MKLKLATLFCALSMLSACGSPEGQALGLHVVGKGAEKVGDGIANILTKAFACSFSWSIDESVKLPETEIPFYLELVELSRNQRLNNGNFLSRIGKDNSEKLKNLLLEEYSKKTYKYSYRDYLGLTIKTFVHIANTQNSEDAIWTVSNIYQVKEYDEKEKKHYDSPYRIAIVVPLIPISEATSSENRKTHAYCI